MMASLLRGVLARRIATNFSGASVDKNQLPRGIKDHFLDARNFSRAFVTNNVVSESDFFSQLEKDRKVSILGIIEWKLSFNQVMKSKFKGSNFPPLKPPGCHSDPTQHQIDLSASALIESVDRLRKQEPRCNILHGAMYMVYTDPRFKTYDEFAKMKILSKVLDVIENYPQDKATLQSIWEEAFHMRLRIKSCAVDDSKNILSEEQVVSRVVDVVKSYLNVSYTDKVNRESHFSKELKLNYIERRHINTALKTEFKMYLPLNVDSCERAIDYIYHNQKQRMSLQEFRDQFSYANILKERFRILCLYMGPKVASSVATSMVLLAILFKILNRYRSYAD